METNLSRPASPSPVLLWISLLLATALCAGMAIHWLHAADQPPERVLKAEGYVKRVRKLLDSPTQALALKGRQLIFDAQRADSDEQAFYQHSQWLRQDIERFNEGAPGFFRLRRQKDRFWVELDAQAHDLLLPVSDPDDLPAVTLAGRDLPVLQTRGLSLIFEENRTGAETRPLESREWLPQPSDREAQVREYMAPSFHLRLAGENLLLLTQPENGLILLTPLSTKGTTFRLNGTPLTGPAADSARLATLRKRVSGAHDTSFPLLEGDRLLIQLPGGQEVALRMARGLGGLHLAGQGGADLPLAREARVALRNLQGVPGVSFNGSLSPMTLDPQLHTRVEQALRDHVQRLDKQIRSRLPDIDMHPACVTVLDARSGEALALASYPDPGTLARWRAALNRGQDIGSATDHLLRLERNQNLERFPIGSTTKPLLAAAIWDTVPALRKLQVNGGRETREMYGHSLKDDPMHNPSDATHWGPVEWLEKSSNPYTLAAYMAALAPPDSYTLDRQGLLKPNGGRLDLSRWLHDDGRIKTDAFIGKSPGGMPLVNQKLQSLFDISLMEPDGEQTPFFDSRVLQPWLDDVGLKTLPAALRTICPRTTHLEMGSFSSFRNHLVSMTIGGGSNQWTNLKLAEAYARLGTGTKVEATLVRRATATTFPKLELDPAALSLVQQGMEAVVMRDGTASKVLKATVRAQQSRLSAQGLDLVILAKTGTAKRTDRRESAAIAFYLALHDRRAERRAALSCTIYLEDRANSPGVLNSTNAVLLAQELLPALVAHLERQAAPLPGTGTPLKK